MLGLIYLASMAGILLFLLLTSLWLNRWAKRRAWPWRKRLGLVLAFLAGFYLAMWPKHIPARIEFARLCKTVAGEQIFHTVENVEGFYQDGGMLSLSPWMEAGYLYVDKVRSGSPERIASAEDFAYWQKHTAKALLRGGLSHYKRSRAWIGEDGYWKYEGSFVREPSRYRVSTRREHYDYHIMAWVQEIHDTETGTLLAQSKELAFDRSDLSSWERNTQFWMRSDGLCAMPELEGKPAMILRVLKPVGNDYMQRILRARAKYEAVQREKAGRGG